MTIEQIKKMMQSNQYEFLRTNPHLKGRVILIGLGGSHAYGTNVEGSDVDIRGCALNSKEEILTNQNFECFENTDTDTVIRRSTIDERGTFSNMSYDGANYYSDESVAKNNARADELMRQLRRFAVEHRESSIYWSKDYCNAKWSIIYDCPNNRVISRKHWDARELFVVYFDSKETAELAIEVFHDELTWYFTEYKDSL